MLPQGGSAAIIWFFFQVSLRVHTSGFQNQIKNCPFDFFSSSRTNIESQILAYQVLTAGLGIGGAKIKKTLQCFYIPFLFLPVAMVSLHGARFPFLKLFQPFSLSESGSEYIYILPFNFTKSVWAIRGVFPL